MESWNSAMPGFESSMPQSVPAAQPSQGNDLISSILKTVSSPVDPNLVRQANMPIEGTHAASLPTSLSTPVGPYQTAPLDQRQVTGRKAANRQGISNAFTAATNALGTIVTKEAQIKQGHIRDAATKVIMAQQGIDEAKIAHDQAITAGDAAAASKYQEAIQKNQQARDAIFADPKMRKALQKGFDISYTDPASNKTEEHAAVQEALKTAKSMQEKREIMKAQQEKQNQASGSAMGAAFEKSMPQGMAANQLAQAQLGQVLADKKIQQEAMKNLLTFQASTYRSDKAYNATQMRTIAQGILKQATFAHQDQQMAQRFAQAQKMLGQRFAQENSLVYLRAKTNRQLENDVYTDKEFDPLTMKTKSEKVSQTYNSSYLADQNDIAKLIVARDKEFSSGSKPSWYKNGQLATDDPAAKSYEAYNLQIRNLESMRDLDKQKADHYEQVSKQISQAFPSLTGVGNDTGSSDGSSSQSDAVGGSDDFTNPFNWLTSGSESANADDEQ